MRIGAGLLARRRASWCGPGNGGHSLETQLKQAAEKCEKRFLSG